MISDSAELSLTKRDLALARLIFAGLSCDDTGVTVGLSGWMVRFIARGREASRRQGLPGHPTTRGCVRRGRIRSNPLSVIPKLNECTDRRRFPRALADDELARLLAVSPHHRGLVYLVAVLAGLRRGELGKLTWGDVDLETGTLRVRIGVGQAAREDYIPLHPKLSDALGGAKPMNTKALDKVFPTIPAIRTVYQDFAKADIVLVDDQGRHADLHGPPTLPMRRSRRNWPCVSCGTPT